MMGGSILVSGCSSGTGGFRARVSLRARFSNSSVLVQSQPYNSFSGLVPSLPPANTSHEPKPKSKSCVNDMNGSAEFGEKIALMLKSESGIVLREGSIGRGVARTSEDMVFEVDIC